MDNNKNNDKCQICGRNKYCLEGVYFDPEEGFSHI